MRRFSVRVLPVSTAVHENIRLSTPMLRRNFRGLWAARDVYHVGLFDRILQEFRALRVCMMIYAFRRPCYEEFYVALNNIPNECRVPYRMLGFYAYV